MYEPRYADTAYHSNLVPDDLEYRFVEWQRGISLECITDYSSNKYTKSCASPFDLSKASGNTFIRLDTDENCNGQDETFWYCSGMSYPLWIFTHVDGQQAFGNCWSNKDSHTANVLETNCQPRYEKKEWQTYDLRTTFKCASDYSHTIKCANFEKIEGDNAYTCHEAYDGESTTCSGGNLWVPLLWDETCVGPASSGPAGLKRDSEDKCKKPGCSVIPEELMLDCHGQFCNENGLYAVQDLSNECGQCNQKLCKTSSNISIPLIPDVECTDSSFKEACVGTEEETHPFSIVNHTSQEACEDAHGKCLGYVKKYRCSMDPENKFGLKRPFTKYMDLDDDCNPSRIEFKQYDPSIHKKYEFCIHGLTRSACIFEDPTLDDVGIVDFHITEEECYEKYSDADVFNQEWVRWNPHECENIIAPHNYFTCYAHYDDGRIFGVDDGFCTPSQGDLRGNHNFCLADMADGFDASESTNSMIWFNTDKSTCQGKSGCYVDNVLKNHACLVDGELHLDHTRLECAQKILNVLGDAGIEYSNRIKNYDLREKTKTATEQIKYDTRLIQDVEKALNKLYSDWFLSNDRNANTFYARGYTGTYDNVKWQLTYQLDTYKERKEKWMLEKQTIESEFNEMERMYDIMLDNETSMQAIVEELKNNAKFNWTYFDDQNQYFAIDTESKCSDLKDNNSTRHLSVQYYNTYFIADEEGYEQMHKDGLLPNSWPSQLEFNTNYSWPKQLEWNIVECLEADDVSVHRESSSRCIGKPEFNDDEEACLGARDLENSLMYWFRPVSLGPYAPIEVGECRRKKFSWSTDYETTCSSYSTASGPRRFAPENINVACYNSCFSDIRFESSCTQSCGKCTWFDTEDEDTCKTMAENKAWDNQKKECVFMGDFDIEIKPRNVTELVNGTNVTELRNVKIFHLKKVSELEQNNTLFELNLRFNPEAECKSMAASRAWDTSDCIRKVDSVYGTTYYGDPKSYDPTTHNYVNDKTTCTPTNLIKPWRKSCVVMDSTSDYGQRIFTNLTEEECISLTAESRSINKWRMPFLDDTKIWHSQLSYKDISIRTRTDCEFINSFEYPKDIWKNTWQPFSVSFDSYAIEDRTIKTRPNGFLYCNDPYVNTKNCYVGNWYSGESNTWQEACLVGDITDIEECLQRESLDPVCEWTSKYELNEVQYYDCLERKDTNLTLHTYESLKANPGFISGPSLASQGITKCVEDPTKVGEMRYSALTLPSSKTKDCTWSSYSNALNMDSKFLGHTDLKIECRDMVLDRNPNAIGAAHDSITKSCFAVFGKTLDSDEGTFSTCEFDTVCTDIWEFTYDASDKDRQKYKSCTQMSRAYSRIKETLYDSNRFLREQYHGEEAMIAAIKTLNTTLIDTLLDYGGFVSDKMLDEAVKTNISRVVQVMLGKDTTFTEKSNALFFAVDNNNIEIARIILASEYGRSLANKEFTMLDCPKFPRGYCYSNDKDIIINPLDENVQTREHCETLGDIPKIIEEYEVCIDKAQTNGENNIQQKSCKGKNI